MTTDRGPEPAPSPEPPLWAAGEFALRVADAGGAAARVVRVGRPFGLVGRSEGVDVQLEDQAVSARHVYLHLDRRGLFAVDLATRTGTRVGPAGPPAGWLRPGQALEVAGNRLELADVRVDAPEPAGAARIEPADPLADSGPAPRVRVTLDPAAPGGGPVVLNSELVFIGRSAACGVRVEGPNVARIQCVLVRTAAAAFLVDLVGRGTWLNGRPLRGAAALADGDALAIGAVAFAARVEPAPSWSPAAHGGLALRPGTPGTALVTTANAAAGGGGPALDGLTELLPAGLPPPPPGLVPTEGQAALLAWMMGVLQAGQAELARRQDDFQHEVLQTLRQLQAENTGLLNRQFEKTEALHRELSELRDEIRRRFGPTTGPAPTPPNPPLPRPPAVAPLRLPTAAEPAPADPSSAAHWLLDRVNRIDQENRSSWRDLLGRFGRGK